jgi:TM1410 hypothetical-related protein.
MSALFGVPLETEPPLPWVVYYGNSAPLEAFIPFQWVVLDPAFRTIVRGLQDQKKQVFGYISLGEIRKDDPYFSVMKEAGVTLEENPNWPESVMVDMRRREWVTWLIEIKIPDILFRGFHGLFFRYIG